MSDTNIPLLKICISLNLRLLFLEFCKKHLKTPSKSWTVKSNQEVEVEVQQFMENNVKNAEGIGTAQQMMVCGQEPCTIRCRQEAQVNIQRTIS